MAAHFGEIAEYFSPGLVLTVLGKEYTVPLPSAELGLWCRAVAALTGELSGSSTPEEMQAAVAKVEKLPKLEGDEDLTLSQRMLGTAYADLVADKVKDPYVEFCAATAYIWVISGEEQAARYWQQGGRPEAPRPANRASRRAASTGAKGTAAASGTRSPASTSGTRSRKTSGSRKTSR